MCYHNVIYLKYTKKKITKMKININRSSLKKKSSINFSPILMVETTGVDHEAKLQGV